MLIKQCPACGSEFATRLERCLDCAAPLGHPIEDGDVLPSEAFETQTDESVVGLVSTDLEAFTEANWSELTERLDRDEIAFERDGTRVLVSPADTEATLEAVVAVQEHLETGPQQVDVVESRVGMPAGAAVRSVAGYLDWVVLALFLVPVWAASSGLVIAAIAGLVGVFGLVILEWRFGTTPGKYLLGLKAVGNEVRSLTLRSALLRKTWLLPQFLPLSGAGLLLGPAVAIITLATIKSGRDSRGWHDHLAGTSVVRSR